jgi:hypothetical protein
MEVSYRVMGDELVVFVSSLSGEVIEAGAGSVVRVPFTIGGKAEEVSIEVEEPVVFTVDEGISFGHGTEFIVNVKALLPTEYSLAQNYPNPFNPTTTIRYAIPSTEQRAERREQRGESREQRTDSGLDALRTTLKIYNILGQEVRALVDEEREPGYYAVTWDGRDEGGNEVPSGVYFYRIQAGDFSATRRMVLMK